MQHHVLGAGLCADAVTRRLPNAGVSLLGTSTKRLFSLECDWMQSPILYSKQRKGLSSYYHGIAPLCILTDKRWISCRKEYNLPTISPEKVRSKDLTFVKFFPIRSRIKQFRYESIDNIDLSDNIHLCLSVVGNLQFLISKSLLPQQVFVGDHLVVKIGRISFEELTSYFGHSFSILTRSGTLFKHIDIANSARLFFRPNLRLSHKNFANSIPQLGKFFISLDPRKLISGTYNKLGYPRLRCSYEVFAQIPVDSLYILTKDRIKHSSDAKAKAYNHIDKVIELCTCRFATFFPYKACSENILPGIHLHYHRRILNDVPSNIRVFDNSLVEDRLMHPAVISAFNAYIKCAQKY